MTNLPAEVLQVLDPATLGEARAVLRSLFDLQGNIGETYLITDGRTLHLFSRKLGGAFEATSWPLSGIDRLSVTTDGLYEVLNLVANGQVQAVRFTSWDQPELDRLMALWKAVAPEATGCSSQTVRATPFAPVVRIPVEPSVLLGASLEAMAEADGEITAVERSAIRHVLGDSQAGTQGTDYLRKHGLEPVLSAVNGRLSDAQKRCLIANLLAVAMSDGLLRSAEQELISRFKEAIALSEGEFRTIHDVMLTLHNLAVFAADPQGEETGLTPVEVFCACLYSMAQEDGRVAGEELAALQQIIPDEAQWRSAAEISSTLGPEGLQAEAGRLSRPRQQCLLANLLVLAMSDGWLRGLEQEEIERFRLAMGIGADDYATTYRVLMAKNDLSVFTGL